MAVYKIFAEKDTTLYSDYGTMNTGMDPILELTKTVSLNYASQSAASRILIKFSDDDILKVVNNHVRSSSFKAYLKLYLADATGLPTDYTIEAFPVYGNWDMGTGQFGDSPITTNGTTWKYRSSDSTNSWETASYQYQSTGSYPYLNPGGGVWYTGSWATQSFGVYTDKDVNLDVTKIVVSQISQSIQNNGILIKTSGSLEFDPAYNYVLNYFSRDTNTVYPPILEIRWDDSSFVPTGSAVSPASSQDLVVSISNNKEEYYEDEIYRYRVSVKDLYPVRTFSTSSFYSNQKYLPSSSYYAIKDVKSDIYVVDFDENYTKISADSKGNYFDVYMYGLEPGRYYKLLIKTLISGSTVIYDNRQFIKIL
jgi:hypothetical protein